MLKDHMALVVNAWGDSKAFPPVSRSVRALVGYPLCIPLISREQYWAGICRIFENLRYCYIAFLPEISLKSIAITAMTSKM